jgi:low affinity Fe/Cu permease
MVFVIQSSQNRDSRAIQLKLDEIIRANADARNDLINLELAPEERLNETAEELTKVAQGEPVDPELAANRNGPA